MTREPDQTLPFGHPEQDNRVDQHNQETLIDTQRTSHDPDEVSLSYPRNRCTIPLETVYPDQTELTKSRPPTPNWPGFAPQPNFQEAREKDQEAFEVGETANHSSFS